MMEKRYDIDVLCDNCWNIVWFHIPKGMPLNIFFEKKENQICPNCGCNHGREE